MLGVEKLGALVKDHDKLPGTRHEDLDSKESY